MIKTQIITEGDEAIAVILDYHEYQRLKAIEEDYQDYQSAVEIKKSNNVWVSHEALKNGIGLSDKNE